MVTWLLHFSSLLRVLRFLFWAACVTEWKIIFVIYSPGLKFTIKLLYYHLCQISMYRIIDTCIMNMKRFWVPLLQLLVTSFCLFIYLLLLYYYNYYHYYYYCCYYSYCHYNYYQLYFFFVESTNRLLEEVKFQYQGISVESGWDIDMHLSLENWLQWIKNS